MQPLEMVKTRFQINTGHNQALWVGAKHPPRALRAQAAILSVQALPQC